MPAYPTHDMTGSEATEHHACVHADVLAAHPHRQAPHGCGRRMPTTHCRLSLPGDHTMPPSPCLHIPHMTWHAVRRQSIMRAGTPMCWPHRQGSQHKQSSTCTKVRLLSCQRLQLTSESPVRGSTSNKSTDNGALATWCPERAASRSARPVPGKLGVKPGQLR